MSSCGERSAKQQHHLAIVLHLHFASLTTGPSDIKKSDMASHLSSAEQFLARRMLGTTLGFFASPHLKSLGFQLQAWFACTDLVVLQREQTTQILDYIGVCC